MTALAANTIREQSVDTLALTTEEYDMGDDIIYMGAMVCLNTSGYAVAAGDTTGYTFVGIAAEYKTNAGGSNGDKQIRVYTNGTWRFAHASAAVTDIGSRVYVTDDDTVNIDNGGTHSVYCGNVTNLIRSGTATAYLATHVLVNIRPATMATSVANRLGEQGNIATGEIGSISIIRQDSCTAAGDTAIFASDAPFSFLVIDAWAVRIEAGATGTFKVTDGTSDIIPAVTQAATDKLLSRAAQIDDSKYAIAKGGSLEVTCTGTAYTPDVYIKIMRSA